MSASLVRREGESDSAYHIRLVYGKMVDKSLADIDYTELAPLIYGQEYSADSARKMLYGSAYTLQLLDKCQVESMSGDEILNELELKKIELQKERQRFLDMRREFSKIVRERARAEELNAIMTDSIRHAVDNGTLPALDPDVVWVLPDEGSDNDLLVSLNDIHFGANINNAWTVYNSDVCAKMMEQYAANIIRIGKLHRSSRCIIWSNGDAISGNIHPQISASNKENIIEQVMGVSELIAQFVAILANDFSEVKYVSVAGNHSRIASKDDAILHERLDDLVEWYLKARMASFENVEIGFGDRIDTTMYVVNVRGKNYLGVHGDFDVSPAHIQALQTMARMPIYAVLMGHKHHNEQNNIQGIKLFMAGSFMGMDDYCIQKRIYGKPEQLVLVCDQNGVRCSYDIGLEL